MRGSGDSCGTGGIPARREAARHGGYGDHVTMMTFQTFSEMLIGEWVGHRRSAAFEQEAVRSHWRMALHGSFLHERWLTAGSGLLPEPTAEALFRISDSGPGDFIAAYKSGRIAFGESTFRDSEWTLTHRWLRERGVAIIRLRFRDEHTYEQDVAEVAEDGAETRESVVVLRRVRACTDLASSDHCQLAPGVRPAYSPYPK